MTTLRIDVMFVKVERDLTADLIDSNSRRIPALRLLYWIVGAVFVASLSLVIGDARLHASEKAITDVPKPLLSECYARVDFRVGTAVEDGDLDVGSLIYQDLMASMRANKWPIATWNYRLDSGPSYDRAGYVRLFYSGRCEERKIFAEEWIGEFCEKYSVCGSHSVELPPLDPKRKFPCQPFWRACDW